ncbi:aldose epimerase family protein [Lewinella sp. W8]|uniref:aldose epimerase family protein n=1 Tax=Lewinella sp. W8 TaxID=2528208 RepID=UPI001067B9B3|nr:aldose epimerase family protein [Lewinella sp. W8]MTB50425.1 galactose-1-epimerase [Lewinella sp. W8]
MKDSRFAPLNDWLAPGAVLFLFVLLFSFTSCGTSGSEEAPATAEESSTADTVQVRSYGETPDGSATLFTLRNVNGMEVDVTNYGGIITAIRVPDNRGAMGDVVLGFADVKGYLGEHPYFGALIGRYGNRIGGGVFTLDGTTYELDRNDGDNALHGGPKGFHRQLYEAKTINPEAGVRGVSLRRVSPDGEEGYPGNLDHTVRYLLTDENELRIEYEATTDAPTVVNLTNHAYFNLGNQPTILEHELMIEAERFTPVDEGLIPTGELKNVAGTPFDFREPHAIGARIGEENEQLELGLGYDHNFVLDRKTDYALERVATLYAPSSGRFMEVLTTEPGLQFYSGNFLDGSLTGKDGKSYEKRSALCLETQHWPDSPNQPDFPSTELRPGETYRSTTVYRFSVR